MLKDIIGLFPTPVGHFELPDGLTKKELDYIKNLEKRPNTGNKSSVINYLTEKKKFSRLTNFFLESANTYLKEIYCPRRDVSLRITQCWANYSEHNEFHHTHRHPNSFVSGVFYAQSDESDKIFFVKPQEYYQLEIPADKFNEYNSSTWWLPAKQNTLYIFPSLFHHFVNSVTADQTRISISFNTFPIGSLGDPDTLTEAKL